jgi:hypothetical protein
MSQNGTQTSVDFLILVLKLNKRNAQFFKIYKNKRQDLRIS